MFTGETGDAVKLSDRCTYHNAFHIKSPAQNHGDNMTLYKARYYDIDKFSQILQLSEEAIRAFRTKLSTNYSDTESYTGKNTGSSFWHFRIYRVSVHQVQNGVLELHEQLDQELLNLITEVQSHESSTVTALEGIPWNCYYRV